jgi:hypothetical protein
VENELTGQVLRADPKNLLGVGLWPKINSPNHQWLIDTAGDATYVENAATGRVMTAPAGPVLQKRATTANQRWLLHGDSSGFFSLQNAETGLVLDVDNYDIETGMSKGEAGVIMWKRASSRRNQEPQLWNITGGTSGLSSWIWPGKVCLESVSMKGFCLTAVHRSTVAMQECWQPCGNHQRWWYIPSLLAEYDQRVAFLESVAEPGLNLATAVDTPGTNSYVAWVSLVTFAPALLSMLLFQLPLLQLACTILSFSLGALVFCRWRRLMIGRLRIWASATSKFSSPDAEIAATGTLPSNEPSPMRAAETVANKRAQLEAIQHARAR